jgi:hypothetical protein
MFNGTQLPALYAVLLRMLFQKRRGEVNWDRISLACDYNIAFKPIQAPLPRETNSDVGEGMYIWSEEWGLVKNRCGEM